MLSLPEMTTTPDNSSGGISPLPSGAPIMLRGLCGFAQPYLRRTQYIPNFFFQDATLLLIVSGTLGLSNATDELIVDNDDSLLLVKPGTWANLHKTPTGPQQCFRSYYLTFSSELLEYFQRGRPHAEPKNLNTVQRTPLDTDLKTTLEWVCNSVLSADISEDRLRFRLLDLLAALAERGLAFNQYQAPSTASRVRLMLSESPAHPWTAREVGRALAMSEATLRRRLSEEQVRFDELLIEVRMHHGLMLLQSTHWSIIQVAEACGYLSRARFTERFTKRFGYLPSSVK
ncbi:helix-turn-helix transcriptional regulator [Rouxiella silvae]